MNLHEACVALAVLAFAVHPSGSPEAAGSAETGILRGVVVDASNLRPIEGARLHVKPGERTAITDTSGAFRLSGIPEGLYEVSAARVGYSAGTQVDVRVARSKAVDLEFQLDATSTPQQTVTVVGAAFPRDPDQAASRTTYTAQEIQRTPGAAGDVFRAIETLPGVSSSGVGFSAFSVRGGGPRDNLILIDGLPFEKVAHLEGGAEGDEAQGGRLSIFAPDLVQSADFRAGGFPAEFGGKSASMLAIRLKDGSAETATLGGRFDLLGWEVDYDGPSRVDPNTTVLFSARHQNLERVLKLIGRADAGAPEFSDFIFKSTTALGARNKLSLLAIAAPEQASRTVENVLSEADTNDTGLYRWNERKGIVGASWQLLAGKTSILRSALYARRYTRDNTQGDSYPDLVTADGRSIASRPNLQSYDESETELGSRSSARFTRGRNAMIVTFEVAVRALDGGRSVNGVDTLYTFDQRDPRPAPGQFYVLANPSDYDRRFHRRATNLGASTSYRRSIGTDGGLTVGARYDHDGVSGQDEVSPRGSLAFPSVRGIALNLASGVYLQSPGLRTLTQNPLNASLPLERSAHFIAGASRLLRPDVKMSVEYYYRTLSDLPVLLDRVSGLYEAIGTGHATGIDVAVVKRLTAQFFGQASYSYCRSRRDDQRGESTYDSDGSQPHAATLLGGYTLSRRWSVSGKFKYATGRPTDAYLVHADIFPGSGLYRYSRELTAHNAQRMPDLVTLNVRVDYNAHIRGTNVVAFLDVLNALNRLNVNGYRFVERSGKTVADGVRAVPTFGLKVLL